MTAYNGSLVLLKVLMYNNYVTIGGMRTTKFSLNNQLIDSSNKDSGAWRQILEDAGMTCVTIAGSGVFTDSESEQKMRELAFSRKLADLQLCFANGNVLEGKFYLTNYERTGNHGEEEIYQLSLESSGEIKYAKN